MNQPSRRILIVDDNTRVRKQLCSLFEKAGFACQEAENGAQAVEQSEMFQPDLIILDFSMPVMNGLEAAPLLRKKLPQIPIIMFTMFANETFAEMAVAAGVTTVISKENAARDLISKTRALLTSPNN